MTRTGVKRRALCRMDMAASRRPHQDYSPWKQFAAGVIFDGTEPVTMKSQRQTILLADDDDNDRFLVEKALREIDAGCVIHTLSSATRRLPISRGGTILRSRPAPVSRLHHHRP